MTAHLIAATITGLIATAVALALRRSSAGLRHAILLAGLLGFAVPTPWLNRAGGKLATCLAPAQAQSFLRFEHFLAAGPLSARPERSEALPAPSHLLRDAWWSLWAALLATMLAVYLRRLLQAVPAVREANPVESAALDRAKARKPPAAAQNQRKIQQTWPRLASLLRASFPGADLSLAREVTLCITTADRAPGARGMRRPCVILPDLLSDQLSDAELQAVIAHELAHIARHDSLSAAIARVIVSVFWFHPLVWWMERRLLAEREAACDERVLAHGTDPADYVSAILKVCRMSFAGTAAYAGATGSDLKSRMEQIMTVHNTSTQAVHPPSFFLRAIPGAVLLLAAILPAGEGFLHGQTPAQATIHHGNDAAFQQAYECWKQGKFQEAEDLFRQIYVRDPEDPRGAVGLSETYVSENRTEDAIELMRTEADKHPDRTDLQTALANLYVRAEKYDQAIAELKSAGQSLSEEERTGLLFRLAEANRRKGDLNEAARLFRAAAALNPKDTKSLLGLALILDGTGRVDEATSVYEQILKLDPNQPVVLNNLAYLVAQKDADPDRALSLAQQAAQASKDSPDVQDTLGWAYLQKNRPDDAIAAFRAALQAQPNNPTFHYHLGMALLPIGERDAAIQELQTALAGHPNAQDAAKIRELLEKIAQ